MQQTISRRGFNKAVLTTVAAAGLGLGADRSFAQEKKTLRFGHMWPAESGWGQASQKFADLVKEKTGGAVAVTVFPNGQLGSERELFESLSLGNLDITFGGPGVLTSFDKKIGIFDMPFLFRDYAHANAVMDGPIGASVFESLRQAAGIRVLASGAQGFRYVMTGSKPINAMADLAGVKIRVPEADTFLQAFRLVGANPVSIPWGETYLAVQSGVADGLEGVPEVLMNFKMYEVAKNVARTNHILATLQLLIGDQVFAALSPEHQKAIAAAATEAWNAQRDAAQRLNEQAEKDLEGLKVAFTSPDLEPFRNAVKGFWDDWAKSAGAQEQIAAIRA